MKTLTQEQMNSILSNAPEGTNKRQLVDELVMGGVDIEGIDNQGIRLKVKNSQRDVEMENVGTGFTPSFESNPDDSLITSSFKTLGNAPKSAFRLGADITSAVTHPIRTAKAIGQTVKGLGGEIGEAFLERTSIGNSLLEKANERRIKSGQPELQRDDQGQLQAVGIPEMEITEKLGNFISERYGSLDSLKETMVEDPVGVLADIAGIVTGTGAALKTVGTASKIEKLASVGSKVSKIGATLEPSSIISKSVSKVADATKGTRNIVTNVVGDIIPSTGKVQSKSVVKALDFTQGEVKSFKKNFGKNIGEYISEKQVGTGKLLGDTPEATLSNAKALKETSYKSVRDAVSKVEGRYITKDTKGILSSSIEELSKVGFGFEDEIAELNKLVKQKDYSLSDMQRIKEIIDERYNIYRKSGDVASGNKSQALNKTRNEIKTLIEKETLKQTGVDVKQLNEDVRIAYAIDDAIEAGSTRELTRNQIGLSDHIIGTGLGIGVLGGGISIGMAVGLYVAKKTLESPAFRIGIAKGISKLKNNKVLELTKQLNANTLTTENKAILKGIMKNAEKSAPITGTIEKAL